MPMSISVGSLLILSFVLIAFAFRMRSRSRVWLAATASNTTTWKQNRYLANVAACAYRIACLLAGAAVISALAILFRTLEPRIRIWLAVGVIALAGLGALASLFKALLQPVAKLAWTMLYTRRDVALSVSLVAFTVGALSCVLMWSVWLLSSDKDMCNQVYQGVWSNLKAGKH